MDFFMQVISDRVEADNVLRKVSSLIDWKRVGWKVGKVRSKLGRAGYDVDLMVRVMLLGQWHSLSDRELEHALRVRLDFMLFCGAAIIADSPDHTTICRFRGALVRLGLHEELLAEVNRQLKVHGLMMEAAPVAVVDATIVESAARPRRQIEAMPEDRREDQAQETPDHPVTERLSADPDAAWLKKGRKSFFGYKVFARSDGEGFVDKLLARPANEGEAPHLAAMAAGCEAARLLTDKGFASRSNREMLAGLGLKSGIMFRAARGHPLSHWQKQFNRLVSKARWIIEQAFGTLKRKFHAARARYLTREKVEAQMTFKATAMNLLKAASKIELLVA
jgi:IS5 family transposase